MIEPKYFNKRFAWFLKKHELKYSNAMLILTYGALAKVDSQMVARNGDSSILDNTKRY